MNEHLAHLRKINFFQLSLVFLVCAISLTPQKSNFDQAVTEAKIVETIYKNRDRYPEVLLSPTKWNYAISEFQHFRENYLFNQFFLNDLKWFARFPNCPDYNVPFLSAEAYAADCFKTLFYPTDKSLTLAEFRKYYNSLFVPKDLRIPKTLDTEKAYLQNTLEHGNDGSTPILTEEEFEKIIENIEQNTSADTGLEDDNYYRPLVGEYEISIWKIKVIPDLIDYDDYNQTIYILSNLTLPPAEEHQTYSRGYGAISNLPSLLFRINDWQYIVKNQNRHNEFISKQLPVTGDMHYFSGLPLIGRSFEEQFYYLNKISNNIKVFDNLPVSNLLSFMADIQPIYQDKISIFGATIGSGTGVTILIYVIFFTSVYFYVHFRATYELSTRLKKPVYDIYPWIGTYNTLSAKILFYMSVAGSPIFAMLALNYLTDVFKDPVNFAGGLLCMAGSLVMFTTLIRTRGHKVQPPEENG